MGGDVLRDRSPGDLPVLRVHVAENLNGLLEPFWGRKRRKKQRKKNRRILPKQILFVVFLFNYFNKYIYIGRSKRSGSGLF